MNCLDFRKYGGAFADGELTTERNLDALEHLKMCPDCVRRVDGIHALKRALTRLGAGEKAPAALAARIVADLNSPAAKTGLYPSSRWFRIGLVPMGLAAGFILAFWVSRPWSGPQIQPGQTTLLKALAVDARDQHRRCEVMGPEHHDPALPRELNSVVKPLSEQLRLRVIAPDLSAAGYRFVGADRCGIRGRPGAHLLYQSVARGLFLSVFTVPRLDDLQMNRFSGEDGHWYFAASDEELTVVAWSDGPQSYVWCAREAESDLLAFADQFRGPSSPRKLDQDEGSGKG